jgi:hypothetical protein
MQGSSTLIAAQLAADLRSKGVEVLDLSVGEPISRRLISLNNTHAMVSRRDTRNILRQPG